nr:spry domain-containing protein 3 [Quercus suber]
MADQHQPPPGPPPEYRYGMSQNHQQHIGSGHIGQGTSELGSNNPFRQSRIGARQDSYQPIHGEALPAYQAPPGPPPSWRDDKKTTHGDEYAPPPGPPPIHSGEDNAEPPPYDPWLAVPDNALLPPPPSVFEERSPTANASYDDAARGHAWCRQNPLWQPRPQNQPTLSCISTGDLYLTTPPNAHQHISVSTIGPGKSHVRTTPSCPDSILLSDLPVYTATTSQPQTLYFEVHVTRMGGDSATAEEADAGIALGFVAPPYPSWRLPGWHRASLGVHGDDGRRYIDNSFGGRDFVSMFNANDTVGLGMTFSPPAYAGARPGCQVFFTRNGRREDGHVRTTPSCPDSILLSDLPVYTATTSQPQTLYFEVHVTRMGGDSATAEEADAGIALGFVAPPYPSWRLPGWHRASLGVHGDDGRRYIDNSFGGRDFVSMFNANDTVGLGMTFSPPAYAGARPGCQVFFTRNGRREDGWDLHEERDKEQEEGDVTGLEGRHDLLAAVGCFGGVEFETRFRREEWMFRP